jgi:opacity protein-like surface antigen
MTLLSRVAATLLLPISLALPVSIAAAQSSAHFGLQGGATIPTSGFGSDKQTGYHLGILVDAPTPVPLFGFRVEGAYHELKYSGNSTRAQVWMAGADLTLKVPTPTRVSPYVIGGAGIYNSRRNLIVATGSTTKLGVNIGGGLRFGLAEGAVFVEARYHRCSGDNGVQMVPITIGLVF